MDNDLPRCAACRQSVPADATRCPACGDMLRDFKECPRCCERVRAGARVCRYCGFAFPRTVDRPVTASLADVLEARPLQVSAPTSVPATRDEETADEFDFTIAATPLGGMLCNRAVTPLVRPPEMRVTNHEINLKTWSLLGLQSVEQKIPLGRVTSVRLTLGMMWGSIVVETFGGGVSDYELCGLDKDEAREMVQILERFVLRRAAGTRDSAGRDPVVVGGTDGLA